MASNERVSGYNILLIPSTSCGWTDLRNVLVSLPSVAAVNEASSLQHATQLTTHHSPDLIIAAARIGNESTVPFLRQRRTSDFSESEILVIGSTADPEDFAATKVVSLAGYLTWSDLTTATLPQIVSVVLETDLLVISPQAAQRFLDVFLPTADRRRLTETERRVLQRLVEGCTDREIATLEPISERTVERIVAKFETERDARSRFALGFEVGRRGLLVDHD